MSVESSATGQYEFPNKNVPDKEKDGKYILGTIKAYHTQWAAYPTTSFSGTTGSVLGDSWNFYAAPWEMDRYRDFSRGTNTGDNLRKAHQLNDADANGAQTAMKVNWTPSKVQWKRMNAVARLMYGRETELVADAIDPTSSDRRMRERYKKVARIYNAQDPTMLAAAANVGMDVSIPQDQPQTIEEFNIWEAMGPKDAEAQSCTLAIALMHNKADYKNRVRVRLAEELRDTGIGILVHEVSPEGLPYSRVIKAEDAVLPWSEDNFRDPVMGGYISFLTPEEVLVKVGDEWGPQDSSERAAKVKQLYDLAKNGTGDGRNYQLGNNTLLNRRRGRVAVFTCFFKDINHFPISKRKGKGKRDVYAVGEKGGKWTTKREEYEVVYKGNWIIGTSDGGSTNSKTYCLHWGCSLAYNQPRMMNELFTTRIPMTARAYNMSNMRNKSVAAIAIEKCIEIEELTVKIRDFIRKSIPPGLLVNIDAIERTMQDMEMPASVKMAHYIELFQQSGSAVFSEIDSIDPTMSLGSRQEHIKVQPGAIGNISELVQQLEYHKNALDETLGLNDALLGNQTSDRQSVGGLKIQAQAGSNALGFLFDTFDEIEEQAALVEYGLLQCTMQEGFVLEGMSKMMGDPAEKYIRFSSEDDPGSVGIQAVMYMTQEQRAMMDESLNLAVSAGKIEITDRAWILRAKNFDVAMRMLESRINFRAKKAHENQMQLVDRQTQGTQQAAQIQAQSRQEESAMQAQLMTAITQLKADLRLREIQEQGKIDGDLNAQDMMVQMRQDQMKLASMVEQLSMKLENDRYIAMETNNTKREISKETNETKEEIAEESAKKGMESSGEDD